MRTLADPKAVQAVLLDGAANGGDRKRGEELLKKVTEQAIFKVGVQ